MATSSTLEYWSGSAWVKENNLIQLIIKDKLQEPLVLEAMIGNFSDSALNTRESNYGKFLKVRAKEKFSEKYIFYGKVVKTSPDRDGTWGHVVHVMAIDNLRELSNLRLDRDITGCNQRSEVISDMITNNVWSTSGVPNIAVNDSTKFNPSSTSEADDILNKTFKGDRKPILDIMQEVAREDPNGNFFGYDFYLDAEFNGNTATPDLLYFPRSSIPSGPMPASGLTLKYGATESNQVLPIMGDYNFPRQSSEMITRVLIRWIDTQDKPRQTDCILINHGATSGGNFAIGNTITWSGSGSAEVLLVGSNNRWLVIGPDSTNVDGIESNNNWLKPISGLAISGSGHTATVSSVTANPPGSLRESIEQEAEVVSQTYDISSEKGAAVHAASILYQGGDIIIRGQVKTLKWPQYKITGTHTGSNNAGTLTDSTKTFTRFGIFKSDVIKNTSDGSTAIITAVGSTTITGTLSGGTDNNWDTNDTYEIAIPIRAGHQIYIDDIPSGSGISDQVCLVTGIDYTEGPGIQLSNIQLLIASDGRGTIPAIPAKQRIKASENAASVPSNDQSGIKPRSTINWTTTVLFTPDGTNPHNTVDWSSGSLHFFDGSNFSISSGTTGAISAVTYIYFSKSSPTIFQTTTSASTAQGSDNIVLATCENVTAPGTVTIETTTGVLQKNYYTLDTLFDGAQYGRIQVGNLLSGWLNLAANDMANQLPLNKTSDTSDRNAVTDNEKSGAGRGYTGLTSQGFISQNHFLNDLGIGIRSNTGSTYTAILGAGIVGINGSTTMFQIQASDGKAGFGMNSSGTFTCTLDNFGVRLGMNTTGGSSTGLIEFNSPAVGGTPANRYHLTNYFGVFQILGDNTHILRPSNEGGWKFGDVTLYWGNIYNVTYQVRRASGSPATFSTLTSNSAGDLLWNGSAITSGVSLSGNLNWTGLHTYIQEVRNNTSSSTLPSFYATLAPIQTNKGMWFGDESTPGNPNSGFIRLYSSSGVLKYKNSGGTVITLDGGGSALASHQSDGNAHHTPPTNTWRPVTNTSSNSQSDAISAYGLQLHEATTHGGSTDDGVFYLRSDGGYGSQYSVYTHSGSNVTVQIVGGSGIDVTNSGAVFTVAATGGGGGGSGTINSSSTNRGAYYTGSTTLSGTSYYMSQAQVGSTSSRVTTTATQRIYASGDVEFTGLSNTWGGYYLSIDSSGEVMFYASSRKYKENIQDLVLDTSKIFDLTPRQFKYKDTTKVIHFEEDDPEPEETITKIGLSSFGLIAEEVYEHIPELVTLKDGEPDAVNYPLVSILLLEEMKKLRARIEVLEGA